MGCTYVKEFDFGPSKTQVKAYARGGPVKNDGCGCSGPVKKAKGGIVEEATGERYGSRSAMLKHEAAEPPREQKAEGKRHGFPVAPKGPLVGSGK
jgi:hypothetical protein